MVPGRPHLRSIRERFRKELQELPQGLGAGGIPEVQQGFLLQTLKTPTWPEQQQSWDSEWNKAEGTSVVHARLGVPPSFSSPSHSRLLQYLTWRYWIVTLTFAEAKPLVASPAHPAMPSVGQASLSLLLIQPSCQLQSLSLERNNKTLGNGFAVLLPREGRI